MFGIFSYFIDGFSPETANAAGLQKLNIKDTMSTTGTENNFNDFGEPSSSDFFTRVVGGLSTRGGGGRKKDLNPVEMFLSPAMPLFHVLNPCRGGRCIGLPGSSGFSLDDEEIVGCNVVSRILGGKSCRTPIRR